MDFLRIRKKAKERAAARARGAKAGGPRQGPGESRPARKAPPSADTVVTDAAVLEGRLMAELQGPPEPAGAPAGPPPGPPAGSPPGVSEDDFLIAARGPRMPGLAAAALPGRSLPAVVPPGRPPEEERRPWAAGPLDEFLYREDEPGAWILDQGLAAAEPPEAPAPPEARKEYLGFFLGQEEYALEIASVREILRAPVITEVPRGPPDVLGVVTVRGEVMPVVDPRRRLRLPPRPEGAGHRVVVCQHGGTPVGVLVDRVSQVVRLPPSAIEPRPQGVGGAEPGAIAGIGRERERLFIILDPAALLGAGAGREQA